MEIIIEYALLDNFVIDSIIIILVYLLKKEKISFLRVTIASLFGAITAILLPLIIIPSIALIVIKLLIGVAITLIAFKSSSIKKFCLDFFLFMSTTFALGGIGFGIIYLIFGTVEMSFNYAYIATFPMSVVYVLILAWSVGVVNAVRYFYKKRNRNNFIFEIKIVCDNEIVTKGYLDSGNTLIDPKTQKPVIIVGFKTFSKLYKNIQIENLLLKRIDRVGIDDCHYIEYKTINNQSSSILICPIKNIELYDKGKTEQIKECVVGLSFMKFQGNFGCDVLLNQNCF